MQSLRLSAAATYFYSPDGSASRGFLLPRKKWGGV